MDWNDYGVTMFVFGVLLGGAPTWWIMHRRLWRERRRAWVEHETLAIRALRAEARGVVPLRAVIERVRRN